MRPVLAAVLLALPLLSGLATGAQAQTQVLVNNLGQLNTGFGMPLTFDRAQAFTTGSNSEGYTLSSVDVLFGRIDDAALASKLTVTIRSNSSGSPGAVVGTLTNPVISTSTSDRTYNFTHSGLALAANTTYWVVLDLTAVASGTNQIRGTASDAEDADSASGWSIANAGRLRNQNNTGSWISGSLSLKVRINGVVKTTPAVSITGGNAVTEGGDAVFTLTASPAPTGSISVSVTVGQTGDFAASGQTGTRTVTMSGASTTFTVTTDDDGTDEPNGSVSATVNAGTDYTVGSPGAASVSVMDNDSTPAVSITGGNAVTEGGTAVFTLTASPAPTSPIMVNVGISQSGDFGVSTVTRVVTMSGASASVPVITQDDGTDEPNGSVSATVNAGTDYTVGSPDTASVTVRDNDYPVLNYKIPGVSVSARLADTGRTQAYPGDRVVFIWDLVLEKDSDNNDIYPAAHLERFWVSAEVVSSVRGVVRRSGLQMGARTRSFIKLVEAQPGETLTARVRSGGYVYDGRRSVLTYRVVEPSAVTVEVPHFRPGGRGVGGTTSEALKKKALYYAFEGVASHYADRWEHVERWSRVLLAFGMRSHPQLPKFSHLAPMTAAEAQARADQGLTRWVEMAQELRRLEMPRVSISKARGTVEGGEAAFLVWSNPAPKSPLPVSLTVATGGDYGVSGGTRTVTIPTTGGYTLLYGTTDDATEEPDGWVRVTVNPGGSAYSVHSPASQTVDIRDNDGLKTAGAEQATPPVLTLAADAAQVTEGDTVSFTITADKAPLLDLDVYVTAEERMGAGEDEIGIGRSEPVLLKAGETSVTWSFTAYSDEVERADGAIEARIDPSGQDFYQVGDPSTATMALIDDDGTQAPPQPVTVSLAAEQTSVAEENGETKWTIALSRALTAGETVTVPYAVSGGEPGAHWSVEFRAGDNGAGVTRHGHGKNGSELRFTEGGQVATMVLIGRPTTDAVERTIEVAFGTGTRAPSSTGIAAGIELGASFFEVAIIDDDGTQQQQPPVVEPAVSIAAGTSPVTEGGDAVFTITATPAPSAPLAVTVAVAANGDFGVTAGSRTVTIPTGGSATLTLATTDDTTDEPDGSASVTVKDGNGYSVGSPASGSVAIRDDDLPPPVISIAAKVASITEGGDAVFTIAADRAPDADLPVSIAVSETGGGDHVAAQHEGAVTATIRQGTTSVEITVPTVNDTTDEPDGTVTATLKGGSGYTPGSAASASVKVVDDDASSLPMLSIDDTTVGEGAMAQVTIRLSAPSKVPVRVHVGARESSPVSARADEDFMAYVYQGWNAAVFRPGQTVKVHGFFVYDDSHDDGGETFEVFLSNAEGAAIADGVGVVTIQNDDPLPAAWLKRFGRTVAQQTLDGIASRIEAPRTAGMQGTLAGQALAFGPGDGATAGPGEAQPHMAGVPAAGGDAALAMAGIARSFGADTSAPAGPGGAGPFGNGGTDSFGSGFGAPQGQSLAMQSRTMTARDALLGSSFSLTGERDGMGGSLAFWGRASQGRFDGTERGDGTDIRLDGTVTTGLLGADYARGKWLLGLALAQSSAEGDYAALGGSGCPEVGGEVPPLCDGGVRAGDGSIEASLTAAIPYAALQASERLKLWGAAGYGSGEVTVKTAPGGRYSADTSWSMAAAGLRSDLLSPPADDGPALAVTSDALWARTSSEKTRDLAASDSDVTRLRLGLEGSWRMALEGGGHLTPTLEAGARHDGGDAESGFGVEVGGGIAWVDPGLGLSLDLSGRTLLAHEDSDFEDRGYSASLAFDPNPATQRGPSLSLRQDWGGRATGGLDALFAPDPLAERAGQGGSTAAASRWAMEAAYGFPAFGGRFVGSPHVGLGLATGARDYSVGWRLTPEAATAPDLSFGLRATRRESDTAQPEHTVGFEVRARW